MSALHMISLPLDVRAFWQWSAIRGYAADEGRALHHLLTEAFGKGSTRPFRLMMAPRAHSATLYAYSQLDEETLCQTARETGTPDVLKLADPGRLAVKAMPGNWRERRRLAFDVRIRPVRRLVKPLEGWSRAGRRNELSGEPLPQAFRKGAEIDAFLVDRLRRFPEGEPEGIISPTREETYRTWLDERLRPAAELDPQCTRMVRFNRATAERQARIEGPDATLHGELTITDGAAFSKLLASGLGRHTAYGYGMLLLRPARG